MCIRDRSAIVFGLNRACVRKTLVFFLLSFLLGGAVLALSYAAGGAVGLYNGAVYINTSLPSLALVVAAVYGVVTLVCAVGGRRAQAMRRVLPAVAKLGGRESAFSVLADTGCLVQDPLTARPVMLVSLAGAAALLPEGMASAIEEGADAAELIGRYAGQRLPLQMCIRDRNSPSIRFLLSDMGEIALAALLHLSLIHIW